TLAEDIAGLRKQAASYRNRVPRSVDINEWTQYLLEGIRQQRVKLIRMDPKDQLSMGQCKVLSFEVEIEGSFEALARVIAWIENGPRLMRIDSLRVQLPSGQLAMQLNVRGLAIDKADPQQAKKGTKK